MHSIDTTVRKKIPIFKSSISKVVSELMKISSNRCLVRSMNSTTMKVTAKLHDFGLVVWEEIQYIATGRIIKNRKISIQS